MSKKERIEYSDKIAVADLQNELTKSIKKTSSQIKKSLEEAIDEAFKEWINLTSTKKWLKKKAL